MNTNLEQQAELLMSNIEGWETSTLERIGKRINKIGKMSIADVQALNNIADVKGDMKAITKELARVTGLNVRQIEKIYGDALAEQHLANKPLYDYRNKVFIPFEDNIELQALVHAYAKDTAKEVLNLSGTNVLRVRNDKGQFVKMEKGYRDILNKATMQVASGATDFHTAMREAIKQMGGGGMRVEYESGVKRRLDTAVRQSILSGAKKASVAYNEMIGEELGCDGIEIDYHANPRPSHAFMQGKQYVLGKARKCNGIYFESADEALERLEDYNCYHYKTPIICGISEPRYSDKELAELKARDERKFNIDGHEMTGYEASQAMRRIETAVREEKGVKAMAQASGDPLAVRECNKRIKRYQAKYKEISDITGIAQDKKRMTLTGADKIKSTQTAKTPATPKSVKNVDNSAKSDIIKNEVKRANKWENDLKPRGQVTETISKDNLYSWVANDLGISEDIATEYAKSVRAYSSAFYTPIRELQRGEEIGGKFNIEEVEKYSNNIETYIRKAHRWNGGETFRGISVSFEDRRQHKPGYIVDMGGTSSWTSKKSVAEDFATCTTNFKRPGSIIYHCKTQSKGTGIRHMSEYDNEEEVIVSKEAKYEVIKTMKDEEGITHVYLKEVE